MKAIVVTDRAEGTAGMTLVERPEPQAAINDVIVQVHASEFVGTELTWPSTWTDPSTVTGHRRSPGMSLPEWLPPSAMARRGCPSDSGCSVLRTGIATAPWPSTWPSRHATSRRCRTMSTSRWARAFRSRA